MRYLLAFVVMFVPLLCYDNSDPYRLAVELNLEVHYKMNFSLRCKELARFFLNIFIRHKKQLAAKPPPKLELAENSELAEYLSDRRYKLRFPRGEGFLESWYEESKWLPCFAKNNFFGCDSKAGEIMCLIGIDRECRNFTYEEPCKMKIEQWDLKK